MSKRVLVTGSCGFLGSHVCEIFKKKGWSVTGIDNLTSYEFDRSGYTNNKVRLYNYNYLKKLGIKTKKKDITKLSTIKYCKSLCIDYIVHTAAQPTMTLSIEDPRHDLNVNIIGTFNMLELARKLDIPIVICSSVHVYGNKINHNLIESETRFVSKPESITEEHKILSGDISPLHASKRSGEVYGQCYIDTYGVNVGIFRLTGIYGPRQFAGMHHGWVSNFIIRTLLKLPIYIFGTDKQVRDILYASDVVNSFIQFFKHTNPGVYNIGGGIKHSISLKETLDYIKSVTGIEQNVIMKPGRFGDMYYFVCDITKANRLLRWHPLVDPKEGLELAIKWFRDVLKNNLFEGIV